MEYKFRGKRVDNGEWVYGDLIQYESGEIAILNRFSKHGFEATEILNRYKVVPSTIGQFTGLRDKNGKEIYGGDVVMFENSKHTVEYEKEYACYMLRLSGHYRTTFFDYDSEHLEIIGTIHDNEVSHHD